MTRPVILQLDRVTKQFPTSSTAAVEDVNLTLAQGDLLALLGPSGCGKTTLLRMIAGFEPLQSGAIALAGRTVASPGTWIPPEQRSVGMVFQDFALFPHLTVEQNVAFGLQKVADSAQIKARTADAIAQVRLQGLENRYPYELSGGQQQRVALARALAPRPALILLDEPLSNLDVQVRLRLREEIREVLKSAGISGVFVTHDQEEALAISDQVAVMQQGRLEQLGTPEEVYHHPASRFVAEFVTQANFIAAQRQGQLWQTEVGQFKLPHDEWIESEIGDLMVRQEDLVLEADNEAAVVIRDRHFLGREYCYCLSTPSGKELHARTTTAINLPIGTHVQLSVPDQALRIFPTNTPKLAKTL
ncbi:ABC transporter ATP-binding protein [Trichocoleus sp. FACHB-591]|nr:ABC transporter ATP-binding protein [Trichocoleus sp. FACHB-591]MBD2095522.1 ABC transporter ATP-binding protein [Trichocoleus sp. FACHB-591]